MNAGAEGEMKKKLKNESRLVKKEDQPPLPTTQEEGDDKQQGRPKTLALASATMTYQDITHTGVVT